MQYIKTEGLLIDTVNQQFNVLNDAISLSANTKQFSLFDGDGLTIDATKKEINILNGVFSLSAESNANQFKIFDDGIVDQKSIGILNTGNVTKDRSVSINTTNSTVSSNSFSLNSKDSVSKNNSILLAGSSNENVDQSVSIFGSANNLSLSSVNILSNSSNSSNKSVSILANNSTQSNNSISIGGNNNNSNTNSINLNSSNSTLSVSSIAIAGNQNILNNSISLNSNNSNLTDKSVGIYSTNSTLSLSSLAIGGNQNSLKENSFSTLSNNITSEKNSSIFNSFNSTVSSNSIQIHGNNNLVDKGSVLIQGNSNFITNSSINIGFDNNKVYDNSLNIDGFNNLISSNSIALNSSDSNLRTGSLSINTINSNLSTNSILINTRNTTSQLSSFGLIGSNNTLSDRSISLIGSNNIITTNSLGFDTNNSTITGNSVVFNGESNIANDFSLVVSSNASKAYTESSIIGGKNNIASLSSVSIGSVNTQIIGPNSQSIGGSNNNFRSSNSVFLGGQNNTSANTPNGTGIGTNSIIVGGNGNKSGNNGIILGGTNNNVQNNSIVIGGNSNNTGNFSNVVILGRNNIIADKNNIVYLPDINATGDLTITGGITAGGSIVSVSTLTGSASAFDLNNYLYDIPTLKVNQSKVGFTETANFFYNNQPRLGVNNVGVSINTFASNSNQALSVAGNVSAQGNLKVDNQLLIGGNDVNLYRSAADTLKTDDTLIVGNITVPASLATGSTNNVVINNSNTLSQRTINSRVWDTNATFLSGSPTTNRILKSTGLNTIGNSSITDDGSTVSITGRLSASTFDLNSNSNDVIVSNAGEFERRPINTRVWDTSAPFVSAITSNSFQTNKVLKASNGAGITNSIITDNGSTITVSGNLSATGTLNIDTINTGTGNSFIIENNGLLQKRSINSAALNTTNNFVSATNTLTTNYITKASNSNGITPSNVFDNGTNVGIGNSSPNEKLTVSGNISSTGSLKFLEGTTNANGVQFGTDTFLYRSNANTLKTDDNFVIDYNGGKTTLQLTNTTANVGITIGGDTNLYRSGANRLATDDTLVFANTLAVGNTNNVLTLSSDGSVNSRTINSAIWDTAATFLSSVGTITQNKIAKWSNTKGLTNSVLSDNGTILSIDGGAATAIGFNGETTTTESIAPVSDGLIIKYDYNLFGSNQDGLLIEKTDENANTPDGGVLFTNRGANGSRVDAFSIKGDGNVGIGLKNPDTKLHISGNLKATGTANIGTLNTGSTNTVITHSGNIFQQRTINDRVWQTNARFLSGTDLTSNRLIKSNGTDHTLLNSSITDDGSLVTFSNPVRVNNGSSSTCGIQFTNGAFTNNGFYFDATAGTGGIKAALAGSYKFGITSNYLYIADKLGIGTTELGTEKLNVNGVSKLEDLFINSNGQQWLISTKKPAGTGRNFFIGGGGQFVSGSSTDGSYNTSMGVYALSALTTGQQNTAVGYDALRSNTQGTYNTAVGVNALDGNTTGSYNTAVGVEALLSNTDNTQNTAVGYRALRSNNFGQDNTAVGVDALYTNQFGSNNSAFGNYALNKNSSGSSNNCFGYYAGYNITSGFDNSIFGSSAGNSLTEGIYNVLLGSYSGTSITTGHQNIAIGCYSNSSYNVGSCVAIGHFALLNNRNNENVAIGDSAGIASGTSGNSTGLTLVGCQAAYSNNTGDDITAIGYKSLYTGTNASSAVAIGANSLYRATGSGNIGIGVNSGIISGTGGATLTTGTNNILIGHNSRPSAANGTNQIVIGNNLAGSNNNRVTIGSSTGHIWNDYTLNAVWASPSDKSLKKNIQTNNLGLNFIKKINPVTFNWLETNKLDKNHPQYSETNKKDSNVEILGLIAQDVKQAIDEENAQYFSGWSKDDSGIQGVSLEPFVLPLINAVKELSERLEKLENKIN